MNRCPALVVAIAAGETPGEALEVQLGEGATAGDLLLELADRIGTLFAPRLHGRRGLCATCPSLRTPRRD